MRVAFDDIEGLAAAERMQVMPSQDPAVEARGHRPGTPYIEHVYVAFLGPSATWLWQRHARVATARPSTAIDMTELVASLGLATGETARPTGRTRTGRRRCGTRCAASDPLLLSQGFDAVAEVEFERATGPDCDTVILALSVGDV